ncbi:hypothetical protein Emag_004259 [Eimeria magna]
MSTSKESEGGPPAGAPPVGGPQGAPQGGAPPAGGGGPPSGGGAPGNAALTPEDLSFAYNAGLRNNNELTQQLLLDQVGVWTADIRKTTGLQTHIIQRGVRNLCENLQLIKPVKNIQVKNRKMYILAHMEPSKEIAGGSFYTNGEFNEQLVEARWRQQEDRTFAACTGGQREQLQQQQQQHEQQQQWCGVYVQWNQSENLRLLESVPCVGCALLEDCRAEGRVNPSDCTYLSHWLGLDVELDLKMHLLLELPIRMHVEATGEEDAAAYTRERLTVGLSFEDEGLRLRGLIAVHGRGLGVIAPVAAAAANNQAAAAAKHPSSSSSSKQPQLQKEPHLRALQHTSSM